MILTVPVKLLADKNQAVILRDTLRTANSACCWISNKALAAKTFSKFPIQKAFYKDARASFPSLSSQMIVRAIGKVASTYKPNQNCAGKRFRPLGSFAYDARILTWNMAENTVSIWAIGGRLMVPFVCGIQQKQSLAFNRGEARLVFKNGQFFLFVSITAPDRIASPSHAWLGVDLGLVNLARTSDGQTFGDAGKVAGIRKRRWRQRKRLQSKGTRSARRVFRRLSGREARFVRDANHIISKQICAEAKRTERGIALEDLRYIRDRIRARKSQRRVLHSWAFADLQSKIAYKGRLSGIEVKFIDPRNTSRTCPACGHIAKANRKTRDLFACVKCGFTADADTNGAENIRLAAINQPNARDGVRAHVASLSESG